MRAILGIILVVTFVLMLQTAEELGCIFVLSFIGFVCTAIKFIDKVKPKA